MIEINGNTQLTGIIGNPIGHSLSPFLQNSFSASLGLNRVYVPIKAEEKDLEQVMSGLWAMGFTGVNVTIPYKEKISKYLVGISPEAELIGAVNTLVRKGNGFWGDNTDGRGFINALEERHWHPRDKKVIILGSGGSARAVSISLAQRGIKNIVFINRNLNKAKEISKVISELGVSTGVVAWNDLLVNKLIADSDLVVNTTPLGMAPNIGYMPPLNTKILSKGQFIVDLIYNPLETRFLREAKEQGCQVENGLGMLIHQGIISFEIWTGQRPSVKDIRSKLEAVLTAGSN